LVDLILWAIFWNDTFCILAFDKLVSSEQIWKTCATMNAAKPLKARRPKEDKDLPIHVVNRELLEFREAFEISVGVFRDRVIDQLETVRTKVDSRKVLSAKQEESLLPALRDVLLTLRTLKVRPEKGRRRDLKQFEAISEELCKLLEKWA
jgi:hypothetical protein